MTLGSTPGASWAGPVRSGWVVRDEVPGPDVDEFADDERVVAALAEPGAAGTLLAVQHPHRTPESLAAGRSLLDALPVARAALAGLRASAYRPVADVVAPYLIDGPAGTVAGVLCLVDPAAVDGAGLARVRHSEEVYRAVVAERAAMLTGLGCATSAALLVPVGDGGPLTAAVHAAVGPLGDPEVSTVDSGGNRHRLWLLGSGPEQDALLAEVQRQPLLVADGNHRVAAAAASGSGALLALVTGGPGLRIGAIHRALTGTGLTGAELVAAWQRLGLRTAPLADPAPPRRPGTVVLRVPGRAWSVRLPPPEPGEPLPRIDHGLLERVLIEQALDIDPEGPRLHAVPEGRRPPAGTDAVLLLAPVPYADVLAVHDQGRRMPRKSTYFTPKPRSGLLLADLPG